MRIVGFLLITLLSCSESREGITTQEFKDLLLNISNGWSEQDTDLALSSFHVDAIYMEPPNIQYYRGHEQLRPYFEALESKHQMLFHTIMFDEANQVGAGEFTFSDGKAISDVGVAIIKVKNGKIFFWREYVKKGPTNFKEFLQIEDKKWKWTIENYP